MILKLLSKQLSCINFLCRRDSSMVYLCVDGSNKTASDQLLHRAGSRNLACITGSRPGTGYSSGCPVASSERAFADALWKYAGIIFPNKERRLLSWSLGGFANSFLGEINLIHH